MALMGLREYARHRKCALRAVQKAIDSGRIKLVHVDGERWPKIDQAQADHDWRENTDHSRQNVMNELGPDGGPPPPGGDEDELPDDSTAVARRARAEREEIRRDRERIELDKLKGSLIDLAEAKRMAFTAFRSLRDSLLNIPARIKDQVAAESDPLLVEQMIDRELAATLASFDLARVTADDEDNDDT
jgi:hypothetical protein